MPRPRFSGTGVPRKTFTSETAPQSASPSPSDTSCAFFGDRASAKIGALLKVLPTRGNFKGIEVKQFEMERIDCKIAADQIEGIGAYAGWTADGGTLHISVPDSLDPYDKDVTFTKNSDGDFVGTAQLEGFTLNQRHGTATITLKPDADPTSVNTAAFVVELAE